MWHGEVCKRCLRRNVIGFNVPNRIWWMVSKGRYNILCPTCFDELAEQVRIAYKFDSVFPVSWSQW